MLCAKSEHSYDLSDEAIVCSERKRLVSLAYSGVYSAYPPHSAPNLVPRVSYLPPSLGMRLCRQLGG